MKKMSESPEGKWFTFVLNLLAKIAKKRREWDFKDSYTYNRLISDADSELKRWMEILRCKDDIPEFFYPLVVKSLREAFYYGRWPGEISELAKEIIGLYEEEGA